ncbi:alpha/beta-hydrolase [Pyrenochaeta sp. DS3sAY3a]|nr:alpha/beta-hydrolase [Pyrenochaeta sp. DS3sAY3a]
MALSYLRAKSSILPPLFSPLLTALFSRIPFWQRWRTLFLQPLSLLAAALTSPSWLFSNQYEVLYIPTRGGRHIRCLVFQPPRETSGTVKSRNVNSKENAKAKDSNTTTKHTDLRPLHIDIHGGGFIGGLPEHNARFCAFVAAHTAAVVVSLSYRLAPAHTYPAAHDDVDDAVAWLVAHAAERLSADPALVTLGGSSAGGNLALSAAVGMGVAREVMEHEGTQTQPQTQTQMVPRPLACLAFYPVLDLRLRAEHKSQPPGFVDPFAFLMPLYDVYGGTEREQLTNEARLHVTLAERRVLPGRMLVVVAEIDILREEQMGMVERLEREREGGEGGKGEVEVEVEVIDVKGGFHGFLELPSFVLEKERMMVFERSVEVIREVHRKNGFDLGKID